MAYYARHLTFGRLVNRGALAEQILMTGVVILTLQTWALWEDMRIPRRIFALVGVVRFVLEEPIFLAERFIVCRDKLFSSHSIEDIYYPMCVACFLGVFTNPASRRL